MDEQPITMRVFPGDLSQAYYTSVLAFRSTPTIEVIRLSLERLQIFEDKTLYELYEGQADNPKECWRKLDEEEHPISIQELWKRGQSKEKEMRFFLRRKEHASLVLSDIVSQFISPDANEGLVEDLCNLEELSEQDMLSNLRARFNNKNIYTYVGSILISVNPYYYYSIYNPKYTAMYMGKPFGALPPHIFAVADNAYHSMLNDRHNQSIIISGESGAGKTESTKFLLHHLMSLSAKLDDSQSLELITLGTGPVLEAFGNARTVANNNSSRFGKFILIKFRENGAYHGASIEKYLLEKSRIVSQAPEERNYHVFYYLLSGADAETRAELQLMDMDQYKYLTQGSSLAPENGVEEYHRLRQSLSMLQFSDELQMRMFTVLSAILHIGNISFVKKSGEEAAVVSNRDTLRLISSLLQVEEKTLHDALTTRKSMAGGTDFFVTPYRVEEAVAMRDTLARALYGALFDWIVDQVNVTLAACGVQVSHKGNSIGVLDIFGFEVFQKNSFEQFCINYANEQLQQYFNKHIFKIEQVEYEAEGIEWSSVSFVDNQDCIDLVAKKPTGLLQLLDEECSFPGADDDSLFQKFERQQKNHAHYRSPQLKQQDPQFTILHYASEVTYSVKGFREKNRDLMRSDIVNVLQASRMDLIRALIGLPPYTVYRWQMAYLKVIAVFAFRKAGKLQREKLDKRLTTAIPFKFRHSSSPVLSNQQESTDGKEKYVDANAQPLTPGKPSAEPFPMEHGHLRVGVGLRTSRSYDLLTEAAKQVAKDEKSEASSSSSFHSLPYGASPRSSRKNHSSNQSDTAHPLRTSSQPTPVATTSTTGSTTANTPSSSASPLSTSAPPPSSSSSHHPTSSPAQIKKQLAYARTKKPIKAPPTKARKHRAQQRSKEAPASLSPKSWKSVPARVKGPASCPRLLHSLARKPSIRHGPSKTVSGQFHMSLVSLMERLEMTNPFFIRCIKSNNSKSPCQFDDDLVLRQLRYTGMMETVKIRKSGYPVRVDFKDFYEKYQFLIGSESADLSGQISTFLTGLGFGSEHFQIGKTKVFMREKQKQALQTELGDKVLAKIVIIQRWTRAKIQRCRFLHIRRSAITIQCAVRCWRARKRADYLRKRVCSAVLIQSAWKTYTARKKLILLKQAAIILQAHYKGRLARKRFAVLLEKAREEWERKRKEEEILRKKREREKHEAQTKERRERRERELQEALRKAEEEQRLHQQQEEVAQMDGANNEIVLRRRTKSAGHNECPVVRETRMLDAEVVDTLFQLDSVVGELERDMLVEQTPSPMPQSSPAAGRKISGSSLNSIEQPSPSSELSSSLDSDLCREMTGTPGGGMKQFPSPPRSRALPNVNQLKQQFLSPQRPSSAPLHRDGQDLMLVKGNVKHIIAQMQTSTNTTTGSDTEQPRSLTPPVVSDQVKKRHSIAIQSKISEFSQQWNEQRDEKKERRKSQSYTPPAVRKKIQSPFLLEGFKLKTEEAKIVSPPRTRKKPKLEREVDLSLADTKEKLLETLSHEVLPPTRRKEEVRVEEKEVTILSPTKKEEESSVETEEVITLTQKEQAPPTMTEDEFKMKPESAPAVRTKEISPEQEVVVADLRERSLSPTREEPLPTKVEDKSPVVELPTRTREKSPMKGELANTERERSPMKEELPARTREKSPMVEELVNGGKEKSPTPVSLGEHVADHSADLTNSKENEVIETPHEVTSPMKTDNNMDEIKSMEPLKGEEEKIDVGKTPSVTENNLQLTEVVSTPSMEAEKSSDDSHLVEFMVLSYPHKKSSKKKAKVDLADLAPPEEVATPEDVELTFEENENASTSTSTLESEQRYEAPRKDSLLLESPHRVEVVIGMKENGIFLPPKIVEDDSSTPPPSKKLSSQYDHLSKRSQYDHLAPLEPGEDPHTPFQRHRSASDVGSHRIRPVTKSSLHEERASSEVVHREDQRYGSLQQRKRVAVSVVDPVEYFAHTSPIEASSEFTRRLTSEEILHLNQRQPLHSPSDRTRLFSFTKRHLKLPFSRSKNKRDKEKAFSPEKEPYKGLTPLRQKRSSPTSGRFTASERHDGTKKSPHDALAHNFKQTTGSRFSIQQCEVCHKGFTGFMKQALRCVDCYIMVHRHCEDRVPPCKAHIESGSYVTMSRNKVVKKLEDLDNLGQFLLEKIATLSRDEQPDSLVDRVFKLSLSEFHTSLISSYSLTLQSSLESSTESQRSQGEKVSLSEEPRVSITFSQLVNNFSNIFKGIAKREGLNDPCHISIGSNQIKTFLDEFSKARRAKRYSASINPSALRRKAPSGKELQPKVHKGHRFFPRQFKVATVCEYCSKLVPLLENGEVCEVCGYACHEDCYKKTHKKCEGKTRSKPIPEYNPKPAASNQFGVPLTDLVPSGVVKVPPILEKCFQYLENEGLYTQGVYRKSAGVSSKKAVRAALEEDPENASLDGFSVHAVAAAVGGFFRELPEPLLTRELYTEFIRAMDLTLKKEKLETLHKLIHRLPELNYIVFERLVFHLARFAQHEHINKMGPNNLAIIFAPCLLQSKEKKNPEEILKDLQKQTECLEVIITEQMEKLTATLRGIRSLTSHARSKASKLTQLIDQFESTQSDCSTKPSDTTIVSSSLSEEERKRLANELEEIERERVELTVNLPKLEPFILSEDELEQQEQESGSSEHWTMSPSPPPSPTSTHSSGSFFSRSLQGFPPISEVGEQPQQASFSLGGSFGRRRAASMKSPPKSPSTPTIVVETSSPAGSPAPKLKHLTKDRVSQKPSKRPPSRKREGINRTTSYEGPASRYIVDVHDQHSSRSSTLNSHWNDDDDDDDDIMFMESTV